METGNKIIDEALKQSSLETVFPQIHISYKILKETVTKHFPSLWPQLHAFLAATVSICWSDADIPIALIATGPSGSGKTEPLMWITRCGLDVTVRSDDFTPASFVSHAANVKKKDLEKNDLLPRIQDKVLCTKELAPLFSGREDELRTAFAKLTTILDGEGLLTSSGTHGTRGYSERIVFAWLGATTPPSNKVFNLMAALGTRLFFFCTDARPPKAEDYAALIKGKKKKTDGKTESKEAVAKYLRQFFDLIPSRSLSTDSICVPEEIANDVGLLCEALTRLRGGISLGEGNSEEEDRYTTPSIEHGWRAVQVLETLAKGSALIRGSQRVEKADYEMVHHICLSSMPETRRKVFEVFLTQEGAVKAEIIAQKANMAKKTALHYLKELSILGVVDGNTGSEPYYFTLKREFHALLTHTTPVPVTVQNSSKESTQTQLSIQNHYAQGVTPNDGVCELPEGF